MIYCHIHTARDGVAHADATLLRSAARSPGLVNGAHRDAPPKGLRSGEFRRGTKTEN
jgi:hypothetical protein